MKNRNFKIRNDELIFDMLRLWNTLSATFNTLNEEMTRNYNMLVSQLQWKPEWKAELEEAGRSAFAYNLLRVVVNSIMGLDAQNRKQVKAKPTGTGDVKMTEIVTKVLYHFLKGTNFDWHTTRMMIDSIIAKFGVINIGWSYDKNPEGDFFATAIDPRRIRFELNFADPTWNAAGYVFDKHQLSLEDILNKYALNDMEMQDAILFEAKAFFEQDQGKRDKWLSKKLRSLFSAALEVVTGSGHNLIESPGYSQFLQWWDPTTGKFDVLELHEKRTERRLLIPDQTGKGLIDITDQSREPDGIKFNNEKIDLIKQKYNLRGEPRAELDSVKFISAVVPAFNVVLNEQPYPWKIEGYTYKPNYCYDYHADPFRTQSVIDDLIDPQSDYNKARNLKLELLYRYANSGWIMDENAIIGVEEDWYTNSLAPYRRVRSGYMGQVKPEQHQVISADLIRETGEAPALIDRISNLGAAAKGSGPNEKSAKLFRDKRDQQEKSFSHIFTNRDNTTNAIAKDGWKIIQTMVTTNRIFRITVDNKENMSEQEINIAVNQQEFGFHPLTDQLIKTVKNDITIGEYDFEIDKTTYSSSANEIMFLQLADLLEATIQINPKKADVLLSYMVRVGQFPYGDQIIAKWADMEGLPPEQQQLQQLMMQVQQIMAKLGIEEKQLELVEKKVGIQKESVEIIGIELDNQKKKQEIRLAKLNVLGGVMGIGKTKSKSNNKDFVGQHFSSN